MERRVIAELLDDDLGTAAEVSDSLADLRQINNWFGGTRTTTELLRRVAGESRCRQLSVLDVGAGGGEVPLTAQRILAGEGVEVIVTLLDRRCSHLPSDGTAAVVGDALSLPFRDQAFDVVSCSLLAHHFDPPTVQRFGYEALRVCRRAVLINDLIRSRTHWLLVYLGLPLFRSRLTRHDALASVWRAYTREEMRRMLGTLPAQRVEISRHYLYRMGVLLWKSEGQQSVISN